MSRNEIVRVICLGSVAIGGWSCWAGPVRMADVAAEPSWVVHVDCDNLRATDVSQYILGELKKPEAQAKLQAFTAIFNFDPLKDLHGLTLYSKGKAPVDAVLLAYVDVDPARLSVLAKAGIDYTSTNHNQHLIHSYIDQKRHSRDGGKPRVYASIINSNMLVLGQREPTVAEALDVLDKTAPNLASSKALEGFGSNDSGYAVEAAVRKLELPEEDPEAALFRLAKFARLQIGEQQHQLTGRLTLAANSEEIAGQMYSVGQGLVALAKLQQGKPFATRLAEAISVKQQENEVVGTLTLPSSDVISMMKAVSARHEAKAEQEEGK